MKISEYLEERKLSVSEFADIVGVAQTTIWRYLHRKIQPNASTIRKIVAATNGQIRAEDLLYEISRKAG